MAQTKIKYSQLTLSKHQLKQHFVNNLKTFQVKYLIKRVDCIGLILELLLGGLKCTNHQLFWPEWEVTKCNLALVIICDRAAMSHNWVTHWEKSPPFYFFILASFPAWHFFCIDSLKYFCTCERQLCTFNLGFLTIILWVLQSEIILLITVCFMSHCQSLIWRKCGNLQMVQSVIFLVELCSGRQ